MSTGNKVKCKIFLILENDIKIKNPEIIILKKKKWMKWAGDFLRAIGDDNLFI